MDSFTCPILAVSAESGAGKARLRTKGLCGMSKKIVSRNTERDIVIPDDAVELVRACLDSGDNAQWTIGDTMNALREELCRRRGDWDDLTDSMATKAQCDESTLRDRASMARFFEPADRTEFGLSYHQLRACKSAGKALWRSYAEKAVTSADDYAGQPAPCKVIRAWIAHDKNGQPEEPVWLSQARRIVSMCRSACDNQDAPSEWGQACLELIGRAGEILPEWE